MVELGGGDEFHASHAAVVGRYTYRPDADEWTWSDAMYRIHGFEPGDVVPTTELVLRHIHPDDVPAAWDSRETVVKLRRPFSFLHRIRTASNEERVVLAAGHLEDQDGTPVVHGHLIDVTNLRDQDTNVHLQSAVQDFSEHRSVIEQAKGVLVQLYSVDADTAFALLRAFSADTNRKVRDIAPVLVAAASGDHTPSKQRPGSAHDMLAMLHASANDAASAVTS